MVSVWQGEIRVKWIKEVITIRVNTKIHCWQVVLK